MSETSLINWSDLDVTQFVLGSENIARKSDLSVTRPTRALKEPDKMNKAVVKAKMGAVLSNMPINGCFCTTKSSGKDAKVMCMFSLEIEIGLCSNFCYGF